MRQNFGAPPQREIIPISYGCQEEGMLIKATTKHHTWRFRIANNVHQIDLKANFIKRTHELHLNNTEVTNERNIFSQAFECEFHVEGIPFKVFKIDDGYDIKFNNQLFSMLYNGIKSREKYGYGLEDIQGSQFGVQGNQMNNQQNQPQQMNSQQSQQHQKKPKDYVPKGMRMARDARNNM